MRRKVKREDANRILSRVADQYSFWLCTNEKLYTIKQLADALERINEDVFRYHVNRDKSDFENWIRDIIQDRELAREIARIKTKETLTRKILDRVEILETSAGKGAIRKAKKKIKK